MVSLHSNKALRLLETKRTFCSADSLSKRAQSYSSWLPLDGKGQTSLWPFSPFAPHWFRAPRFGIEHPRRKALPALNKYWILFLAFV